ncbi:MAG: hypothetical protein LBB76_09395 [Azoarcus sp.]|jgi:hypothetical protein|nr:hypothetical protein [Azoarcus sp.]
MTLNEAYDAYYAKFPEAGPPEITWFPGLPDETQLEILMQGINGNTPITGKVAEKIERRLYPRHYADPRNVLI